MHVKEIAKLSGVLPNTVRYYTRIGLLRPVRNPRNGYKQYTDAEAARLRFIRQAKNLGFTLSEIAQVINESRAGRSPCPLIRQIVERRVEENQRVLNELTALQRRMQRALTRWSTMPDCRNNGHSVCLLVESIGEN
jgi:DNA-binding transcriptional MerR regulator